jgi:hypothetical protein
MGVTAYAWHATISATAGIYCAAGGKAAQLVTAITDEPPLTIRQAESLDGSLLVGWWTVAASVSTPHIARSRDGGTTWSELTLATEPIPY